MFAGVVRPEHTMQCNATIQSNARFRSGLYNFDFCIKTIQGIKFFLLFSLLLDYSNFLSVSVCVYVGFSFIVVHSFRLSADNGV